MSQGEQNEVNKLQAIDLANNIYKVVMDERFRKVPPDIRHKIVAQKYANFAQVYPVVLRWLSRDLKYSEKAFRTWLDRLEKNPGSGMEGFIEKQADYARVLYIEEHRAAGKHVNFKHANNIYKLEYQNMMKWYKKIRAEEARAKNQFHEEEEENIDKRRKELLDFLTNDQLRSVDDVEPLGKIEEENARLANDLPLKNPNPTFNDIDPNELSDADLITLCAEIDKFIQEKYKVITELMKLVNQDASIVPDMLTAPVDFNGMSRVELNEYRIMQLAKSAAQDEEILTLRAKRDAEMKLAHTAKNARSGRRADHDEWLKDTCLANRPKDKDAKKRKR